MAYIRKVKTKSGATAIQIAHKAGGQLVKLEHLGSCPLFTRIGNINFPG